MANPNLTLLCIAAGLTPVAVGAYVWAVVRPAPGMLLAADLLDTATMLAWVAYIASWYTARVVTRIDQVERAHSVRIFADAVGSPARPDGRGQLRGLS